MGEHSHRDHRDHRHRSSRDDKRHSSSRHSHRSSSRRSDSSERRSSHRRRDDRDSYKRKRRSPSPEDRPAKKRSSAWDEMPPGLDGLSSEEIKARCAQQPVLFTGAPPAAFGMNFSPSMAPITSAPQTQARRLYIGNVPNSATDQDLKDFFTYQFLNAGFASPNNPNFIHSVQINYDRSFGFLELETADLATKGLSFDGISFQDHTLKVRRPRDYQGPDQSPVPGAIRGIVSTNVPDSPNKVFIGGLPSALTEDQVKELVGTFGELKAFHLVKDNQTNVSKGYAFFEYLDPNVTDKACQALNNQVIGDKTLLVQRAHLGAKNSQAAYDMGMAQSTLGCLLNLHLPVTSTLQTNNLLSNIQPTPVLILLNMASLQDLTNEEEVEFLREEVYSECSKFGRIRSIIIPHADDEEMVEKVKGLGKIFVHFEHIDDAISAQRSLVLRKYNNRCVLTAYLDEDLFVNGCYDGPEDADTEQAMMKLQEHYKNETANAQNIANYQEQQTRDYHAVPPPRM